MPKRKIVSKREALPAKPSGEGRRQEAARRFADAVAQARWDEAVEALDMLLAGEPASSQLHYNRALACRLAGRAQDGLASALAARRFDPSHSKALFEIGACALEAGQAETSLEASEAFLAIDPSDADARRNAARAALLLEKPATALDHLGAIPIADHVQDDDLWRAEALRDAGRIAEAEAVWASLPKELAPLVLAARTKGAKGRLALKVTGQATP